MPMFRKHISKFHLYLIFCGSVIFSTGLFGQDSEVGKAAELYVDFEYGKAITMLTPLVEQGDRAAIKLSAFIFSDPFSDYYDPIRVREIFDELAAQGDADAALMLFDESYWNEAVDMQQARANLSDKTIELLLTEAENDYHPAYYRMMLACRFEDLDCSDFTNTARPKYKREFRDFNRIARGYQIYDQTASNLKTVLFDDYLVKSIENIELITGISDPEQKTIFWRMLDVTQNSDPYLATVALVSGIKAMQEFDCEKSYYSTAYAIAIVDRNDFWDMVKNVVDDDVFYAEIVDCATRYKSVNAVDDNDYEFLLDLVAPLIPVFNHRKGYWWQGIAEPTLPYNDWCFLNVQQGRFFRCQFQSYVDHYFRCSSIALDGYLASIGVSSHKNKYTSIGKRYHHCRANYLQKS
jgi:hypothetical protein